jgi:hypothetical protein
MLWVIAVVLIISFYGCLALLRPSPCTVSSMFYESSPWLLCWSASFRGEGCCSRRFSQKGRGT